MPLSPPRRVTLEGILKPTISRKLSVGHHDMSLSLADNCHFWGGSVCFTGGVLLLLQHLSSRSMVGGTFEGVLQRRYVLGIPAHLFGDSARLGVQSRAIFKGDARNNNGPRALELWSKVQKSENWNKSQRKPTRTEMKPCGDTRAKAASRKVT